MPKVGYIKAMDVFMGICFFLVFLSLIKLSVHKYLQSLSKRKKMMIDGPTPETILLEDYDTSKVVKSDSILSPQKTSNKCHLQLLLFINKTSVFFLPVLFIILSLVYFLAYYFMSKNLDVQCWYD